MNSLLSVEANCEHYLLIFQLAHEDRSTANSMSWDAVKRERERHIGRILAIALACTYTMLSKLAWSALEPLAFPCTIRP